MSRWLGLAAAAIGSLALLGWVLEVGRLKSVIPGHVAMKPNAAIGLILLGVALSLVTAARTAAGRLSGGLAILAAALGAATLAENVTGRNFGIDELLFHEAPGATGTVVPGRMATTVAVCLVLLGLALLVVRSDRWIIPAQALAGLVWALALFDLLTVVFGAKGATAENPFTLPAINTSAALFAMASGTLLARADRGPMAVAAADTSGGHLIRRVVPATSAGLVIALAVGDMTHEAGFFGHDVRSAVDATVAIAALVVVAWIVAISLNARELEQRADEAQLHSILNSAGDGILTVDSSGRIRMSNPMAEKIFGYPPGGLDGLALEELVPQRYRQGHPAHRADFESGALGPTARTQVIGLRKDGSEFLGRFTLALLRLPGETQTTAVVRDVTQEKEAERALGDSEERFRTLVEQIPGATFIEVEDPEALGGFRDEFVSPQIFDLFGYTQEEWMAGEQMWLQIVHPDDRPALLAESDRTMATGEPFRMEYRALTRTGDIRWVHEESTRTGHEGNFRWHGMMTDISDRKRLEEAWGETEAAVRAGEMKSEFLSRMSHELRTPMNAILGFAQLLEMDATDGPTRESADHILRAGKHLLELVDEVLEISHAERQAPLGPVALNDLAEEAMASMQEQATGRGIRIKVTGDGGLRANADRAALARALRDLVSNGVKFNRDGGEVEMTLSELPENRVRIAVRDTGEGIPAGKIARLFSPFDRLDAEKTGIEGTGLGLTLVKALVEGMGGKVSATSVEGTGSTFSIELDRADEG